MDMIHIAKTLSPNDTGQTGGHQAGILVPKSQEILSFFPVLPESQKNPRTQLEVTDENECTWNFNFIYYNNRYFGGTRNEYRLTGMTEYMRTYGLKAGDRIALMRDRDGKLRIHHERAETPGQVVRLNTRWIAVRGQF